MPLIIREKTMEWFVARCTYRGATKKDSRWHINARCSAEGERGPTAIVLQMNGDRLLVRWDSGDRRPTEMQRCS